MAAVGGALCSPCAGRGCPWRFELKHLGSTCVTASSASVFDGLQVRILAAADACTEPPWGPCCGGGLCWPEFSDRVPSPSGGGSVVVEGVVRIEVLVHRVRGPKNVAPRRHHRPLLAPAASPRRPSLWRGGTGKWPPLRPGIAAGFTRTPSAISPCRGRGGTFCTVVD